MASHRIGHRLFYIANCMPSFKRQAAASALQGADAAAGEASAGSLRNSSHSCQKPRTMASAAEEVAPEETGRELLHEWCGRRGTLSRGRRRHSPFDLFGSVFPKTNLQFMIDRTASRFDDPFFHRSWMVSGGRSAGEYLARRPLWDFVETDDVYRMRLDLPGLSKEEVKVYVEDSSLVIKAEHSEENKADKAQWASRSHTRDYNTRILLPDNANAEMIKAELKNGVLSVTVPKEVEEEPKKNVIDVEIQ